MFENLPVQSLESRNTKVPPVNRINNPPYPLFKANATDNRTTKHLNIVLRNNEVPAAFSIVGTQAGLIGDRQVSLPNSNQRLKTAPGSKK